MWSFCLVTIILEKISEGYTEENIAPLNSGSRFLLAGAGLFGGTVEFDYFV
jgi:hypothetical protein